MTMVDNICDGLEKAHIDLRLDTLPIEVFLHISSFLESGFLLRRMSLVSKHFYNILCNENTWKIRQTKRWGHHGVYPPVPVNDDEFCWSLSCLKREEQWKLWGDEGNLRNVELKMHIGCVDAVHLFEGGTLLASGSRDRSILIWNVEKCFEEPSPKPVVIKDNAHKGWIWAFCISQSHLLSASWDTTVKIWDRGEDFRLVHQFNTRVACLCLATQDDLVACGTFDKKVLFFDPRKGYEPITWYTAHKKPVLALGMDENRVVTCGEDGKIILYDLRAKKVHKEIVLEHFPTCLSFRKEDPVGLFYVGDKCGNVHLLDSEKFEVVQSYQVGHKRTVQGVFHSLGSVFTCSRDGLLKIFEPSNGLKEIRSISVEAELPAVHALNNTMALAGGDSIVRLWSPVEGF